MYLLYKKLIQSAGRKSFGFKPWDVIVAFSQRICSLSVVLLPRDLAAGDGDEDVPRDREDALHPQQEQLPLLPSYCRLGSTSSEKVPKRRIVL